MAKVQKVVPQITDQLRSLKTDIVFSSVLGDYKGYKTAKKAYAELAKDNFELALNAKGPKVDKIPLFSKTGMRILKIMFFDMFRIKTPAEKEVARLTKIEKAKQKFNIKG